MPETVPPLRSHPGESSEAQTIDVDFDTWARVSAQLLRRSIAERARIIHESGFDATWKRVDGHWFGVLASEAEEGKLDRVDRYQTFCRDEIERRRKNGEQITSPVDRIDGPGSQGSRRRHTTSPFTGTDETEIDDGEDTSIEEDDDIDLDGRETQVALDDIVRVTMDAAKEAMSWPLEKYAWLCAELEHAPDRADQVWTLHGLGKGPARTAVRKAWDQKLDESPQLREQHQQLVKRYSDVLRGE